MSERELIFFMLCRRGFILGAIAGFMLKRLFFIKKRGGSRFAWAKNVSRTWFFYYAWMNDKYKSWCTNVQFFSMVIELYVGLDTSFE